MGKGLLSAARFKRVGFTGTQVGMSVRQMNAMMDWAKENPWVEEFHHGDCVGADAQAHILMTTMYQGPGPTGDRDPKDWYDLLVVIHPPLLDKKRAFCMPRDPAERRGGADHWQKFYLELPAAEYLERNKNIVDSVELLIVAPKSPHEELRSGTWSTYRYAKRIGVPTLILPR